MKKWLIIGWLMLTGTAIATPIGGDFTLTDHRGQRFELPQLRGKVVLLFFGYTNCPVVCPDSLTTMAKVLQLLENDQKRVQPVFVSVDPTRDTVEKLQSYIPFFGDHLLGLTGSEAAVQKVIDAYRVQVRFVRKSASDPYYQLDHTANVYALGPEGKVRTIINYGLPAEHIVKVARGLLSEHSSEDTAASEQQATAVIHQGVDLSAYTGQRVLVNFWASWCPPCRAELPSLNRARLKLPNDIAMVAINVGETPEAVRAFLQDYPIDFPVHTDPQGLSFQRWPIKALPTTLLLDPSGKIAMSVVGERAWDENALLAQVLAL